MHEMYRLMAIAKYDERYVIPTAHVEQAHELEELGCSLDFDGGPYSRVRTVRRGQWPAVAGGRGDLPGAEAAADLRASPLPPINCAVGSTCSTGTATGRPTGCSRPRKEPA